RGMAKRRTFPAQDSIGQLSLACGVPTSEVEPRATSAPAETYLIKIVPCCSDTSSAATPTCCRSFPQAKNACWFHSTSAAYQSERSGRSCTTTAASSTQKMTGSWPPWANLPLQRSEERRVGKECGS